VIGKVCPRGSDVRRLLGYLLRDGRAGEHGLASEHTDAHLIAGWDDPGRLEPARLADGRPDLRRLAGLLNAPLAVAGAPERPVYHLAIAAAKDPRTGALRDPLLSDEQWADIAATYLHHLGLAPRDDPGAVRCVAVRHAGDHIHVVATLARQDGARVQLFRDYAKSRTASHAVEAQYGLTPTGSIDGTSQPATTHAEHRHARQHAQQHADAGQDSRRGQDRQGRERAGGQDPRPYPHGRRQGSGQESGQDTAARVRPDRDVLRHQSPAPPRPATGCRTSLTGSVAPGCWSGSATARSTPGRSPATPSHSHPPSRPGRRGWCGSAAASWHPISPFPDSASAGTRPRAPAALRAPGPGSRPPSPPLPPANGWSGQQPAPTARGGPRRTGSPTPAPTCSSPPPAASRASRADRSPTPPSTTCEPPDRAATASGTAR